jgi:hypothetical protein
MNLVLNEVSVMPGKLRSYLEREQGLHELLAKQPGARAILTVRSLGNPTRFARGGLVDGLAAVHASLESPETEAFLAANPFAGLARAVRPIELYESIAEVGEAAAELKPGMHMLLIDWILDGGPPMVRPFEESRRALLELRQRHSQGFVRSSLYRFLGAPNRYIVVHTSSSREAGMGGLGAAELQAFQAAHPRTIYSSVPPTPAEYEVVKVTRAG